ncbi:MAG TPA: 16S rRNA (cytidine(1402)-2'-O)-methyltransferase [Acidimicrobiales bacterium]|nr:16S rRNA (cytidine(1402)-2'-O)-methyltransferase [Acidimicrobiales bacterium]
MTVDPDILEELEGWADDSESDETDDAGVADGGVLVLVATPIGNLGDLSPRAVEVLSTADVIYCEDTRHSRKLLTHAGITGVRLRSLHQHNEDDRIDEVIGSVAAGRTVAVVSDAGMPGISDPGSRVVAAAATAGLKISVIPGPSAGLAALVTSGLPTDRFCFDGFLPRAGKERRRRLAALAEETRTTVLFEAPGRLAATLADLANQLGDDRPVAVARELTKLHEQIWRGTAAGAAAWALSAPVRGEVVIVVAGAPERAEPEVDDGRLQAALAVRLAGGERTRGAVDAVAEEFGVARRRVYDLALAARNDTPASDVEPTGDRPGGFEGR